MKIADGHPVSRIDELIPWESSATGVRPAAVRPSTVRSKRAINNIYETQGFHAAMHCGIEACSIMDASETPEYAAFDEIRRSRGLNEALRWRDEQFAKYE